MRLTPTRTRTPALAPGPFALALALALVLAGTGIAAPADDPPKNAADGSGHAFNPNVVAASPDADRAMSLFRVPQGLKVGLWAAEPLLANPVAFGFDEHGKVYVVETFRVHNGVTDNRGHMNWLDADLASRSVEDRVAMYRKFLGKEADSYGTEHDRVRLVEDRDGDGKADHAGVFADGFHDLADGVAAGVLARKGDVYFTCIPDLWLLRDTDGDGKADVKKSLHRGYGVHVALLGHDLHGLTFGPDGKLYFSIGDRGVNVKTADGRTLFSPDSGSVFRCDPDGANLEFFATGLRNPQELAFDDYGNLFTVDNNSDSGDKARIVYLIEGSESGWLLSYQYLEKPVSRGPWNAEKVWQTRSADQPAHIVPPVAHVSDGPSGLAYNPGVTLLPEKYKGHFFLADFRGGAGNSGVRAFTVEPDGAGFKLADSEQFLWGVLATDVDFGPDGGLYVSDWVEGWNLTGKGRIYRVADPSASADAIKAAKEVQTLLGGGFDRKGPAELARFLGHADRRVRQEAQFALAARGAGSEPTLRAVAFDRNADRLARLHAVWGLGQVAREAPAAVVAIRPLLADADAEVRAQAVKTLGDLRDTASSADSAKLLRDESPRVRSLAAIAAGKLGRRASADDLLALLRENGDKDPYLRHAAVVGLAGLADVGGLLKAAVDEAPAVRLGALLALRRLKSAEVARFLDDADPRLVTEAARAINDVPIDAAMPALARLIDRPNVPEFALRRAVNAAARQGGAEAARSLAALASRVDAPQAVRVEAVEALADWADPPGRDRVLGLWRPSAAHPVVEASEALAGVLKGLTEGESNRVRFAAVRAAAALKPSGAGEALAKLVGDANRPADVRAEALKAIDQIGDRDRLADEVSVALKDKAAPLRVEGLRLLAKLDPSKAIPMLGGVLEQGGVREKQGALAVLGGMPDGGADDLLAAWLDKLPAGKVPAEVELDLLDAARRRGSAEVSRRLGAVEEKRPQGDPLATYRESLVGGDATRGRKILFEKAEVSCLRCHKVKGEGGEVGPDLTGVGTRQDRQYLLESIVAPNNKIAKGFETLILATNDGQVVSGILKEDTGDSLKLITAEGKPLTVAKAAVEEQKRGASAMPDDLLKHLSKSDVRDLVEYLSGLK